MKRQDMADPDMPDDSTAGGAMCSCPSCGAPLNVNLTSGDAEAPGGEDQGNEANPETDENEASPVASGKMKPAIALVIAKGKKKAA